MDKPEVSALVQVAYDSLAAWRREDEGRWHLLVLVNALMKALEEVDDLVRDTETHAGWGRLLDVNVAPGWALEWLGQFVGVTPVRGQSDEAQRLRIREAAGFRRGSPAAIRAAAQQYLTGSKRVEVYERDGSPWRFRIRTYTAETPDAQAVRRAVEALKPAGLLFVHEVQEGVSIDSLLGAIDSYPTSISSYSDTVPTDDNVDAVPYGMGLYGRGFYGGAR